MSATTAQSAGVPPGVAKGGVAARALITFFSGTVGLGVKIGCSRS